MQRWYRFQQRWLYILIYMTVVTNSATHLLNFGQKNAARLYPRCCLHQDDDSWVKYKVYNSIITDLYCEGMTICLDTFHSSLAGISRGLYLLIKTPSFTKKYTDTLPASSTNNSLLCNSVRLCLISELQ